MQYSTVRYTNNGWGDRAYAFDVFHRVDSGRCRLKSENYQGKPERVLQTDEEGLLLVFFGRGAWYGAGATEKHFFCDR